MTAVSPTSTRRAGRWVPATVATLHLVGTALFALAMARSGPHSITAAVALTAYLLGVRHAFDVDHIVAIDNTTRYLRGRRRPAGSVGFWFSFGHSSVVLIACVLLGLGWNTLTPGQAAAAWGPLVSGTFLVLLAMVNGRILLDLWRVRHDPESVAEGLAARGLMTRAIGRRWSIDRPSQMVAVGFLFGLGFDTATSVGLLLLSAGSNQAVPPLSIFVALPVLFAAGMTLFDSLDGVVMDRAYGWADSTARRLRYNIAVTAVSSAAALAVGGTTLITLTTSLA